MPDEPQWYFAKSGKAQGPMTQHDLCQQYEDGAFTADDFVFCKDKTDGWVKASTIAGLCDSLALDAEPEPEHHQVMPFERAGLSNAVDEKRAKKKEKERDKKFWARLRHKK